MILDESVGVEVVDTTCREVVVTVRREQHAFDCFRGFYCTIPANPPVYVVFVTERGSGLAHQARSQRVCDAYGAIVACVGDQDGPPNFLSSDDFAEVAVTFSVKLPC